MRVLRIVVLLLVALVAWLQYRLWFGHGGAGEVQALQAKVEQQRRDNGGLQQRNDALAAEVKDLKSADGGAAVEERARSELGMIKPGETFYRVVEHQPPVSAETAAAPDPARDHLLDPAPDPASDPPAALEPEPAPDGANGE